MCSSHLEISYLFVLLRDWASPSLNEEHVVSLEFEYNSRLSLKKSISNGFDAFDSNQNEGNSRAPDVSA